MWRLGRVLSATNRRVQIEQVLKSGTKTVLERNPRDVSRIVGVDEYATNSREYFARLMGADGVPATKVPPDAESVKVE